MFNSSNYNSTLNNFSNFNFTQLEVLFSKYTDSLNKYNLTNNLNFTNFIDIIQNKNITIEELIKIMFPNFNFLNENITTNSYTLSNTISSSHSLTNTITSTISNTQTNTKTSSITASKSPSISVFPTNTKIIIVPSITELPHVSDFASITETPRNIDITIITELPSKSPSTTNSKSYSALKSTTPSLTSTPVPSKSEYPSLSISPQFTNSLDSNIPISKIDYYSLDVNITIYGLNETLILNNQPQVNSLLIDIGNTISQSLNIN